MTTHLFSDLEDGRLRMCGICSRMSSRGVIEYAEAAGPTLDTLIEETDADYFRGIRAGLVESVDRAVEIVPTLSCTWIREQEVPVA